jgi:DNA-binding XRE family transcriptional regulator
MNAQQVQAMRAMRTVGKPDSAIARRYGVSRQRVHQLLGARPPAPPRAAPAKAPPAPSRAKFAAALLAWRKRRGLTQVAAARLLRVTPHSVASWETHQCGCSLAAAMMLLMELIP